MDVIKKYPVYRKFIASGFMSTFGDSMYYIALMTYASQFTNSGLAISMVSLSEAIPGIFFIVTGSLADMSHNRAKKNLICGLFRAVVYGIVGVLIGFQPSMMLLAGICLLNFVSDLTGKYASGLMTPFILYIVDRKDIESAQGLNGAITNLVALVAQFSGAYLMGIFSYQVLAWLNSGAFFMAVIILFTIREVLQSVEAEKLVVARETKISVKEIMKQILSSLNEIRNARSVFNIILLFALSNGGLAVLVPLISIFFSQNTPLVIKNFAFTIAICQGLISVGAIIGGLFGPKFAAEWSLKRLCQGLFLCTAGIAFAIFGQQIWLLFFLLLVLGLLLGTSMPKLNILLITHFPVEKLGTISGGVNTLLLLTPPVATGIFTAVATIVSVQASVLLLLVVSVIALIIGQFQGELLPKEQN